MANTCVEKRMKNINIDGVENCNLLCKLIIDYVPSNKCIVKKTENIETFVSAQLDLRTQIDEAKD